MRIIGLTLVVFALSSCNNMVQGPGRNDPAYAPKYPQLQAPKPSTTGSLFADSAYLSLFDDTVARRIGDIITVSLNEKTVSKKSASTTLKKATDNTLLEPTLLSKKIRGVTANGGLLNKFNSSNDFAGSADSDQSNSLSGNIAVTVAAVLPNGTLVVRGEKWMKLNQGDEYIRIEGMIRPVDIDANNTIDSTKIADARITYGGKGVMEDSNRMGWLARFFLSPIFIY